MPGGFALGAEEMHDDAADAVGLDRPDNPADEKDRGHREGQFRSALAPRSKRPVDMKRAGRRIVMTPADGADAREQAEPVQEQDENEDRGEEPEGLLDQIAPDHVLEKIVETLHQPLPEILETRRDRLDFSRGELRAKDEFRRRRSRSPPSNSSPPVCPTWKRTSGLSGSACCSAAADAAASAAKAAVAQSAERAERQQRSGSMMKNDARMKLWFGSSSPMFPVGAAPRKRCTQHKGRLRRAYQSVFCRDDKRTFPKFVVIANG